jgi:RNA ligase (TIGR02306 family)
MNPERKLVSIQKIDKIVPIEGADSIELCHILGWQVIAKKGEFKENDHCGYFEIDSKLPIRPWSEFLASKGYKIKTMKLNRFGGVISQGLALPLETFKDEYEFIKNKGVGDDITEIIGVEHCDTEKTRMRKKDSIDLALKKMSKEFPYSFLLKFNLFNKYYRNKLKKYYENREGKYN